ncbi:choline sulfate utilization transcriptional regulator [Acerihabitans arboris]|uniref:LysR family transcriptional regulator n=1 Tax=Acerihabitans arboris TaxID=2691583 RepID=A0A845SNA1_9GAMM|nr:LysR substrate-binding domain-containing protein [Acerihabitans arboris]NDL64081.1 LysR family transcriptional regulator [Acerihabitans arboris]
MANTFRLPPLQALAVFEAAARHLNFTAAATELGSSQPAVSQRINLLENQLGARLFDRRHRGVALTQTGEQLYKIVRASLQGISQQIEKIQLKKQRDVLRIDTDMGFASYWLLPRLDQLQRLIPNVDVQISTSPNEFSLRDSSAHLAISFGDGQIPGCRSDMLFPELVVPVCSPLFFKQYGGPAAAADLLPLPLLNLPDTQPRRWLSWRDWFRGQGLEPDDGVTSVTFNAYSLIIQAALKSQGVALGWKPLVDQFLENGELVVCGPELKTLRGYYLIQPGLHNNHLLYQKVKKWLISESFSFRPPQENMSISGQRV